jgi:hypothetical protein
MIGLYVALAVAVVFCEPLPSGRDCYEDGNVTVPTIFCSAFLHCECALCTRADRNSSDEFCIAQTPSLNTSIWNCPTPYNQTDIDRCEALHEPARRLFTLLAIAAAACCVAGGVFFIFLYITSRRRRVSFDSL